MTIYYIKLYRRKEFKLEAHLNFNLYLKINLIKKKHHV